MISLKDSVEKLRLVKPENVKALHHLGVRRLLDLLYYFPRDWQDLSEIKSISQIQANERVNLRATLKTLGENRSRWRRFHVVNALFEDKTGSIAAVWFNQPYVRYNLKPGREYYLSGKVYLKDAIQLQNPTYELAKEDTIHTAGIVPVYELTEGVTGKQIRYWLNEVIDLSRTLPDVLPEGIRKKHGFPDLSSALRSIHFPKDYGDLEKSRSRFAFEELFLFQLALLSYKSKLMSLPAPQIRFQVQLIRKFVSSLPFALTHSQRTAVWEILKDLQNPHPMNRLLQGEVGSGKTVVAGIAMLETAKTGYQSIMLAPTEILAWQHYETLHELYKNTNLEIALLTRSHKITPSYSPPHEGERREGVIIGTHALLQEHVKFRNIGLLVIDEQHRFGVKQRSALLRNSNDPNTSEYNEKKQDIKIVEKELSYMLNKVFWKVQEELGRFARERQYADALEAKLKESDIPFKRESAIAAAGRKSNFADFVVAERILIEVKAKPYIQKEDYYQTLRYLKAANLELGFITNFRQEYFKAKRILNPDFHSGNSGESSGHSGRLIPHLLSMTATPIPRTLALAFYGDLDISELRELPKGRKKIITRLVAPEKRAVAYEFIRNKLNEGRQMYVVTPLIGERNPNVTNTPEFDEYSGHSGADSGRSDRYQSGQQEIKTVTAEAEKLKKIFSEFSIGLLHGRLPGEDKKQIMQNFKANKIQILVATSVIEVGVDVPNASVMVIENAERFGLSQLHQLRGRVGRAEHQSYCLLFAENTSDYTRERLTAVVNSNDGFELAEKDLELRGHGEIIGTKQSGFIPFRVAKLSDKKLIKLAKEEAQELLNHDPLLSQYPLLKQKTDQIANEAHLE